MPDTMKEAAYQIQVIIEPDKPGFHAYCPALEGLHVAGDTEEQALQNAKDAAIAYIQSLIDHGDPIPISAKPQKTFKEKTSLSKNHVRRHTKDLLVSIS